jgi:phytoene synthase
VACRPGIQAAALLYAEIGREIERYGGDSVSRRAVVSATRKAQLLAQSVAAFAATARNEGAVPLGEAQYLIDAVGPASRHSRGAGRGGALGRLVWVIDLFDQLERRANLAAAGSDSIRRLRRA